MDVTPRQANHARPTRLVVLALLVALVAAACSSDGNVEAIATNDGGILVKPPDVLEGDPAPTAIPADQLPGPVDSLAATPVVEFTYFDGSAGSTADFAGRPTVVNFWASNCAPCVAEMPEFEEAHQALLGQVDFVGVNVADVSRDAAVTLAEQTGVTYRLIDDSSSQVFRAFGGFVMPTTVLLNPQGQVAFVWSGVLNNSELRNLIDQHIAPGSNADA